MSQIELIGVMVKVGMLVIAQLLYLLAVAFGTFELRDCYTNIFT